MILGVEEWRVLGKQGAELNCRFSDRERSLKVPYKIISCLMYFLRVWEKRAMSSKAATLADDTGVQISPDLCSACGGLVHRNKTGYPKSQSVPCCEAHFHELRGSLCRPPCGSGKATAGLTVCDIKAGTRASNTWILVLNSYKVVNEFFQF